MALSRVYIDYIINALQMGVITYVEVRDLFLRNVKKVSEPTFVKYWKIAKEEFSKIQAEIEKEKQEQYKAAELSQKRLGVLQREEVVKMTSNALVLAYNKVIESKGGDKEIYSYTAVLEKFARLEGFDKPIKTAFTDPEGKDKEQITELIFKVEKTND